MDYEVIKRRALAGFAWLFMGNTGAQLAQLAALAGLARLLTPADFGLVTIAATITSLCASLGIQGFLAVVIQSSTLEEEDLHAMWTFNLVLSAILYAAIALLSPLFAAFYGQAALADVLRVGGALIVLLPLARFHVSLLRRDLSFGTVSALGAVSSVVSMYFALFVAWRGGGYWGLVLQPLMRYLIQWVWAGTKTAYRPRLSLRWGRLGRFGRFYTSASLHDLVLMLQENLDYLILGKFLSPAQLGLYALAYRLSTLIDRRVTQVLGTVSFSAFSRLQEEPERMVRLLRSGMLMTGWILTASLVFLAATGEIWLRLLAGPQWIAAAFPLAFLCIATIFNGVTNLLGCFFLGSGRADLRLYSGVAGTLFLGALLLAAMAIRPGFPAAGAAILLSAVLAHLIAWRLARRFAATGGNPVWRVLPSGAVAGVLGAGPALLLGPLHPPVFAEAALGGIGFLAALALCLFATRFPGMEEIRAFALRRLRRTESAPPPPPPSPNPADPTAPTGANDASAPPGSPAS